MQPMASIALKAAHRAGHLILKASEDHDRIKVDTKSENDFVSEVDKAAEAEVLYHLKKTYPTHGFLCEEGGLIEGREDGTDYLWVIDPLDGTTNFIRGIPHYAVSIACYHQGRLEHGVIYDPCRDESFVASRGRGVQMNGRRLRVNSRANMDGALIGTGIPFKGRHDDKLPAYANCMSDIAGSCAGIRRAGAASLDLAYVAAGRLDAFWEIGLSRWDIAAGVLMIKEAGGLVSDFNGADKYEESGNIVAGSPKCFKAVLKAVHEHLG